VPFGDFSSCNFMVRFPPAFSFFHLDKVLDSEDHPADGGPVFMLDALAYLLEPKGGHSALLDIRAADGAFH
jgi:hypothetical protein